MRKALEDTYCDIRHLKRTVYSVQLGKASNVANEHGKVKVGFKTVCVCGKLST